MPEKPDDESLNTSEIRQVFKISPKRNLSVNLKVTRDSVSSLSATKVPAGEFMGESENQSNKISMKDAAIDVLEEGKKLPTLSPAEKVKP